MRGGATAWRPPPEVLEISDQQVHVWQVSLDLPPERVQALEQMLAEDECRRAAQYRFPADRRRFITARGLLRTILGRYLAQEPQALQFSYSPYGKPMLAGAMASEGWCFNVSHSRHLALYAIARRRAVGIDVESTLAPVAWEEIAGRCFSPEELCLLHAVPPMQRQEAYFRCWTRKEAYLKARGLGLSVALNQLTVSPHSLYDLSPGPGFVAALAVEGSPCQICCWQWTA